MRIEANRIEDISAGGAPFIADEPRQYPAVGKLFADIPRIDALRITCIEKSWPRDFPGMCRNVAQQTWQHLLSTLDRQTIWLFIAHGPWQPNTRIVAHHRLWKGLLKEHGFLAPSGTPEIEVSSKEGLRYAGLCQLTEANFETATKLLRAWPSSTIFLSPRLKQATSETVRDFFSTAFPSPQGTPAKRVEWPRLVAHYCPEGMIFIKPGGHIDERECSLDFIGLSQELDALIQTLPRQWHQNEEQ